MIKKTKFYNRKRSTFLSLLHMFFATMIFIISASAQRIGLRNGSNTSPAMVSVLRIDASNPLITVVTYKVNAGVLSRADFHAPGVNGEAKYGPITAFFSFAFDQRDVPLGSNNITVIYYAQNSTVQRKCTIKVTRTPKEKVVNDVMYITTPSSSLLFSATTASRTLTERYSVLNYSAPVMPNGKLIRTHSAYVHMIFGANEGPSGYGNNHKYQDTTGVINSSQMNPGTAPDVISTNDLLRDSFLSFDSHFIDQSLQGEATTGLLFDGSGAGISATMAGVILPTAITANIK